MRVRTVYCFTSEDDRSLPRDVAHAVNRLRNFWEEDADEVGISAYHRFVNGEFERANLETLQNWLKLLAQRAAKASTPFGPMYKAAVLQSAHNARDVADRLAELQENLKE